VFGCLIDDTIIATSEVSYTNESTPSITKISETHPSISLSTKCFPIHALSR